MQKSMIGALALLGAMLLFGAEFQNKPKEKGPRTEKTASLPEKTTEKQAPAPTKAPRKRLSEQELDHLLAKSPWPRELHSAVKRVAFCESSWISTAKGPTDDYGLMQVRFKNHALKVSTLEQLYDPHVNLRVAYALFSEAKRGKFKHGFAPWFMSNKCHGLVPPKVAANIKKFREQKAKHAMARF